MLFFVFLTFIVTAMLAGNYSNVAFTKSDENKTITNGSSDNITVNPSVGFTVIKTVDKHVVYVGDNVTFIITVNNGGESDATNVVIWDILDEAFEWKSGGSYDASSRNVTWFIPSIGSHKSVKVNVTVTAISVGNFTNVASVISNENKTPTNATSENVTINPDVRLDVTKVVEGDINSVYVGDSIVYVITVTNKGNSTATNVNVTEKLSGLVVVTGATGDGTWDNVTKVWKVGTLAGNGASATLRLTVKVIGNGTVANAVVANSTENTTDVPANSTNVTAKPDVRLNITKEANVTEAVVGDLIKYRITVKNNGLSDATDVSVWDVLPAGVKYVEGGNFDAGSRNVTWSIAKIEAGKSAEVYVIVNVTAAGNLSNTVFANSSDNDTVVNKTSDDIPVKPDVKLDISKVANVTSAVVGDKIVFTITVTNNGLSDATDVVVSDVLDDAFEYVSGGNYDAASRNVTWTIDSIASGESKDVTVVVMVLTAGSVSNNVSVVSRENDTVVTNSSDDIPVIPNVELDVVKVANVTAVKVGDNVEFTIVVTNNGLSDATDVVISDVLDDAFEYVSGGSYDAASRVVMWVANSIAAGQSANVTVVVTAFKAGNFTNVASAYADENRTPVNGSSDNITVNPYVKLDITKVANVTAVYVGDKIEFTITVANSGLSDATDVVIEDVLPDSLKFVSANGTYENDGQNVKWVIDKVEGKSSVSVYVVGETVTNGSAVNFANVTCRENSTSNTTTDKIDVKPVVNLTVVKTANASNIYVGDRVSYNIVVTNNGPSDASNVIVVDELPDGLRFVSSNIDCVVINNKVTWTVKSLASGENITVEVICEAVGSGDLTNTVNVTCDENKTNTTGGTPIHVSDLVDVAIQLSVDNSTPNINGEITLTVTVINYGPSTATEIKGKLNRDFLTGLSIISIESNGIVFHSDLLGYALMNILRVNEDGSFEIASLAPGEQVSATIKARVIHDVNITVDGDVTEHETDSNLLNNHDEVTLIVRPITELDVEVTANETEPTVGDVIEYTITVSNNGPSNATGIIVNDKLPDGVTYVSDDSEGSYDPQTGVWSFDSLKANETKTLTIKVKVNRAGEITNVVDVKSRENPKGTTGNTTINAKDSKVDLVIAKTVSTTKAYVGDIIVYTITVVNRGTNDATSVLVYEDLLDGLRYISDDGNGQYDFDIGIWNIGTLKSGETRVLNIVVEVTKAGNISNFVFIDCDQDIIDINSSYDNVTVEVFEHEKPIENASDNATAKEFIVDSKATGNPFVVLLMALMIAGVGLRRRKE